MNSGNWTFTLLIAKRSFLSTWWNHCKRTFGAKKVLKEKLKVKEQLPGQFEKDTKIIKAKDLRLVGKKWLQRLILSGRTLTTKWMWTSAGCGMKVKNVIHIICEMLAQKKYKHCCNKVASPLHWSLYRKDGPDVNV